MIHFIYHFNIYIFYLIVSALRFLNAPIRTVFIIIIIIIIIVIIIIYLTSITRNSNLTDKPEVDGALILLPPRHQCTVLRVFKAT